MHSIPRDFLDVLLKNIRNASGGVTGPIFFCIKLDQRFLSFILIFRNQFSQDARRENHELKMSAAKVRINIIGDTLQHPGGQTT